MIDAPSSTWFTVSPDWGWLIVLYIFLGGLAGGSYFLGALIDLVGRPEDRPLARLGYYIALPCVTACGLVLLFHLARPERFWHMFVENHTLLPIFKYWSPISMGSWALPAFGLVALLAFLAALAESGRLSWRAARRLRPPGIVGSAIAAIGAVLGLYIAGYPGVMLMVTNRPIWADTPMIGMLFVVSATSISAALMVLLARMRGWKLPGVFALYRMSRWVIALELLVLLALMATLGPVVQAFFNAWGLLLLVGVILMGIAVPLLMHSRADRLGQRAMTAVPVLVLTSGFILRTVIVYLSERL